MPAATAKMAHAGPAGADSAGRALIVESETECQRLLADVLQEMGFHVTTTNTGRDALADLRDHRYQLVITAVQLNGHVDGLRLVRAVRWRWPGTAVVITGDPGTPVQPSSPSGLATSPDRGVYSASGRRRGVDLFEAPEATQALCEDDELSLGAVPCVPKPLTRDRVRAVVRAALDARRDHGGSGETRQGHTTGRRLEWHDLVLDGERHEATLAGDSLDLTPSQFRLLRCLMANAGRVVPSKELAAAIWQERPPSSSPHRGENARAERPPTSSPHRGENARAERPASGSPHRGENGRRNPHGSGERASRRAHQAVRWHVHRLRQKVEPDPESPTYIVNVYGEGYALGSPLDTET